MFPPRRVLEDRALCWGGWRPHVVHGAACGELVLPSRQSPRLPFLQQHTAPPHRGHGWAVLPLLIPWSQTHNQGYGGGGSWGWGGHTWCCGGGHQSTLFWQNCQHHVHPVGSKEHCVPRGHWLMQKCPLAGRAYELKKPAEEGGMAGSDGPAPAHTVPFPPLSNSTWHTAISSSYRLEECILQWQLPRSESQTLKVSSQGTLYPGKTDSVPLRRQDPCGLTAWRLGIFSRMVLDKCTVSAAFMPQLGHRHH